MIQKKNEVRITVIASGFPEEQTNRPSSRENEMPLFDAKPNNQSVPVQHVEAEEKKMRFFSGSPNPAPVKEVKIEEKKEIPKQIEDDDDWGAVPAFLRRSKIK